MCPSPDGELAVLGIFPFVFDVLLYDSPITTGANGGGIIAYLTRTLHPTSLALLDVGEDLFCGDALENP